MKKYIVCKKCGFENLPGTQFCQRCGSKISLKFTDKIASSLAGTGQKGSSLAPLGAMAIEAQTEELGKTAAPPKLVPVEREIVAHVTTSEALGAHDRHVARKLIDLNVPELDRVEFDVE